MSPQPLSASISATTAISSTTATTSATTAANNVLRGVSAPTESTTMVTIPASKPSYLSRTQLDASTPVLEVKSSHHQSEQGQHHQNQPSDSVSKSNLIDPSADTANYSAEQLATTVRSIISAPRSLGTRLLAYLMLIRKVAGLLECLSVCLYSISSLGPVARFRLLYPPFVRRQQQRCIRGSCSGIFK